MTSILDFLGSFGPRSAAKGTELVSEYAKEAASNYLKNGVPLNDTIVKIAQTEALTPEQVEMLIWESNKSVHAVKFASQADKYVEFPLADPAVIMPALQVKRPEISKVASAVCSDFDVPPHRWNSPGGTDTTRDFELCKTASGMHEGLTGEGAQPLKYRAAYTHEKLASQLTELSADLAALQYSIQSNELTFIKEARGAILDLPFNQRMEGFAMIVKAASGVAMKPLYKKGLMKKLAEVLFRQGLMEKNASLDEFISDEIANKCQIINGNHRLYVLLKTLKDEQDRKENLTDRWNVVRTEQTILDEKMRLL